MDAPLFMHRLFSEFYNSSAVEAPPAIEAREFGIGDFGKKIASRHIAFANAADMNKFLRTEAPLYISCSVAYYKFPSRWPMEAKHALGSDLVYEFDANDLKCECAQKHNTWACKCGASGTGIPERCADCGGIPAISDWVCENCLDATKQQVFALLEMLSTDLGISKGISVNFSGNRGYHVHARSEAVRSLAKEARTELLDYLTAHELQPKFHGFYIDESADKKGRMHCPAKAGAVGWNARILSGLEDAFLQWGEEKLAAVAGIQMRESKELLKESNTIIQGMRTGLLYQLPGRRTERFWNSLIAEVVDSKRLKVDRQTSSDMSKLIRVPGTIHGSTGLLAKEVGIGKLKEFQPLRDAVVLPKRSMMVKISRAPEFSLAEERFGPFENETAELPAYAAAYLLGRGTAVLAQ